MEPTLEILGRPSKKTNTTMRDRFEKLKRSNYGEITEAFARMFIFGWDHVSPGKDAGVTKIIPDPGKFCYVTI